VNLDLLLALTLPREIFWPRKLEESWFIDVFDWDTTIIDAAVPSRTSISLDLCSGIFPCSLSIQGRQSQAALILQSELGFISCSFGSGCSGIRLISINISCRRDAIRRPVFKLRDSNIEIINSHFSNCSFEQDGGIVQSFGDSYVFIESSTFHNISSLGSGGVISLFGGKMSVLRSCFTNCLSFQGGGAIWASEYRNCYGDTLSLNTTVVVESSTFWGCSSGSAGGAILVLADTSAEETFTSLQIGSSQFEMCRAASNGGALSISGISVIANVTSTRFLSCYGGNSGGAISASHFSTLAVYGSDFINNFAYGTGGGALCVSKIKFLNFDSLFSGNNAPNGGGGAILWQNRVFPADLPGCPTGMYRRTIPCMVTSDTDDCLWATCALCDTGRYKSEVGFSDCSACAAGTYSWVLGAVECINCPAGYFATARGANSSEVCKPCDPGSFSDSGGSACSLCPSGTYSNETASSECLSCSSGKHSPLVGANDKRWCLSCGHGKYSGNAAAACSDCMISTFASSIGSTSCQSCRSGQYTSIVGATSSEACTTCELGQYVLPGNPQCSLCTTGVYSDVEPLSQDLSVLSFCRITASNGSIGRYVPGGLYSNKERIYWLITSSSLKYITLEFTVFEIEAGYDYVSMYGCLDENCLDDIYDTRFFSSYNTPDPQQFHAVAVLVMWTTDGAGTFSGWTVNYRISTEPLVFTRALPSHQLKLNNHLIISYGNTHHAQSASPAERVLSFSQNSDHLYSNERRFFEVRSELRPLATFRTQNSPFSETTHEYHLVHENAKTSSILRATQNLTHRKQGEIFCSDDSNTALYGSCLASDFKKLSLFGPSNGELTPLLFWPGLTFDLIVAKEDAYNQIILSDSDSYVDILTASGYSDFTSPAFILVGSTSVKLEQGKGKVSVSIRPLFDMIDFRRDFVRLKSKPHLILRGTDTESLTLMQSQIMSLDIRNGSQVCPLGYILQEPTTAGGWATCFLCGAGTYSLNPLASAPGSLSAIPDCLNCPEGGNCDGGGAKVIFSVGKWEQEGGAYVLKHCPGGFQLVNSTNGDSRGTFSHDRQQCKPCLPGQYIINSNTDECEDCPLGQLTCNPACVFNWH
jgi:hypothetical protein